MPETLERATYVYQEGDNAVGPASETVPQERLGGEDTILDGQRRVLTLLQENASEAAEDGALPLSPVAAEFILRVAGEILMQAVRNSLFSTEDFHLVPFARDDGGAHLIVDFATTGKRLTITASADAPNAWVSRTGILVRLPGEQIGSPDVIGRFLGWLTKAG